ncbi:tyrosine-type recombinase/integrase [Azospirillum sp. Marseille-Q6669]
MPTEKLTKRVIDAAKPIATDLMIWDTEVKGFGFKLTPAGHRSFVFLYRGPDGKQRKPTIGRFGSLTVDQARERARELAYHVSTGRDPSLERQHKRSAPKLSELCDRFLEEHVRPKNKPKTAKDTEATIRRIIVPKLGNFRVEDLTRADIAKFHGSLQKTPYHANRCLAILSKMLNLAEIWGLRPEGTNPCRRVEKFPEKPKNRYLSGDEVGKLAEVLVRHESSSPYLVAAIRLLLLTGLRQSEIRTLKWSFIDLDAGRIHLPDTKTGQHTIPITDQVRATLAAIPRVSGNPWVIVGRRPDAPHQDMQPFWQKVRHEAGLDDVRIHDLRHSFASFALAGGTSLAVIGKLMGHRNQSTTARYAHLADDVVRVGATKTADHIGSLLSQNV